MSTALRTLDDLDAIPRGGSSLERVRQVWSRRKWLGILLAVVPLTAGAGMTVFNNIEYSYPDGDDEVLDEDMDTGLFGQIGLSLKSW